MFNIFRINYFFFININKELKFNLVLCARVVNSNSCFFDFYVIFLYFNISDGLLSIPSISET